MVKGDFPVFKDHGKVECFACSKDLGKVKHQESGYPTGAWMKKCSCGKFTFYDIKA